MLVCAKLNLQDNKKTAPVPRADKKTLSFPSSPAHGAVAGTLHDCLHDCLPIVELLPGGRAQRSRNALQIQTKLETCLCVLYHEVTQSAPIFAQASNSTVERAFDILTQGNRAQNS